MIHFLETIKLRNEPLFYFGWLCIVGSLLCIVMLRLSDTQVLGINAWIKPLKFFLSSLLFSWAMAWYMQYLGEEDQSTVVWYSWAIIVLLHIENVYILLQASRGLQSHFNVSTTFTASMWSVMAIAATMISVVTIFIAIAFFKRDFPELPEAYVWAIRLGIVLFIIFSMQGLAMGGRMSHTVGAADGSEGLPFVNWSKQHGDLRIAHFLGMHALQFLPIVAYYLVRNVKMVFVIAFLYAAFTAFVFVQALRGKPFLS
jgi:hypothetical protein